MIQVEGRYVFDIHGDLPGMIASIAAEHTIRDLSIEEPDLEGVIKGIYARGRASASASPWPTAATSS
ncbi:hypothetical protein [Nonomuraea gerenzanensis]|uniref:Uncharacterized protein n=1 Tax=Nonomuraea gerenzanensis TaxID=93944 RepID=A0A1M4EB45_9ACTN|nr:hypothetical protein [Nonomuraea gerenzanensis]UBU18334.1 hypothetical protein LCN96_25925 [Nonomuraea gerenzanensis]SBO96161.1 hypothetical protein BN4615_P5677 [Nonomuraea gerenzanensis]